MRKCLVHIKVSIIDFIAKFSNSLKESNIRFLNGLYKIVDRINKLCFHISSISVLNHKEYNQTYNSVKAEVLFEGRIGYTSNLVYNDSIEEQQLIGCPMDDVVLFHYQDLMLRGDSDILVDQANSILINDMCYNKDDRVVYHDSVKLAQHGNTILIRYQKNSISLDSGIVISGPFSINYYHSVYDNLIRLMTVGKAHIPMRVPLLIDEATINIPSLKTIFECLAQDLKRGFVVLNRKTQYHVKDLYYITHVNHFIPSIKSYDLCKVTDFVFDLNLTLRMRERLMSMKSDKSFPEKIFISRKQTHRRNFNEDEVYEVLRKEGFERVFPENIPIGEQIALFHNARYIVGGGGAAMTNLMFCNSRCKVLIISNSINQVPCFTTVPYALGVRVRYCGQASKDKRLHSNYNVDPQEVIKFLKLLD